MSKQRRVAVLFRSILALGLVAAAGQLTACHHSPLHRSFGLRYREVFAAQSNAHPAHDATARGEEAGRAVRNYFGTYDSPDGGAVGKPIGGGTSAGGGQGQMTAGVMPMH